jgi:hypothetical protein
MVGGALVDPKKILFPVLALGALTFVVLLLIPFHRVRAMRVGRVVIDDFKLGESARVPGDVSIPNRNMMNLLEVPVLFYVACLTLYVTREADAVALLLAWTYVGLRGCHSLVHLTYNNVLHRVTFFAASNVVLSIIWLRLCAALYLG